LRAAGFPRWNLLGRCEGDVIVKTTGRDLIEQVRDIGLGLQSLGLAPGDFASSCSPKAVRNGSSLTSPSWRAAGSRSGVSDAGADQVAFIARG
jgi:hypothetical protein